MLSLVENLFLKNPLQDLLCSLNAVISTENHPSQHKHTASVSCEKTCVWMHAVDNYGQGFTFNKSELSDLEPDVILESRTLNFSSDDTLVRNIWFFLLSFSQNERKIYHFCSVCIFFEGSVFTFQFFE